MSQSVGSEARDIFNLIQANFSPGCAMNTVSSSSYLTPNGDETFIEYNSETKILSVQGVDSIENLGTSSYKLYVYLNLSPTPFHVPSFLTTGSEFKYQLDIASVELPAPDSGASF